MRSTKLSQTHQDINTKLTQPAHSPACDLSALSPGLLALCAPISLTPSPRRRNLEAGGGFGCGLQRLPRRSTSSSSPGDGDCDDNGSSSSFLFAIPAGCCEFPAAAAASFFPSDADGLELGPYWGAERGGNEASATALAGELPRTMTAALQLQQLLAPSVVPLSSASAASAFEPASAFRASSFATERLRLPAEEAGGVGGGGGDRSRQPAGQEGPFPSSLPERLRVGSPLPAPAPPLLLHQGRQCEQQEPPRKRATKKGNGGSGGDGGESADDDDNGGESDESDRDDDEDEDDDADDDFEMDEQAAAMDAEAAHFVRRSSGCGGSGSGNESKNPAAAAAAMAEAARLEEAATVLSASLGAQHPQVGKAWLLVARAHGAGSGGGSGSGGGGERALTKCVFFCLHFSFLPLCLSRSLSPPLTSSKNNEITKKNKTRRTRSARTTSPPSPTAARARRSTAAGRRRRSGRSGRRARRPPPPPLRSLPLRATSSRSSK